MRQVILDTETTGLEVSAGNRIIEIGGVEVIDRRLTGRTYHQYVNPGREIEEGAFEVHGIGSDFLLDKPAFADIAEEFLAFVRGAELVIHNAPFDMAFLNRELELLEHVLRDHPGRLESICEVTDSLVVARERHPGQKNNLDALCRRYGIDNTNRTLHGALLDAEILADVYLTMTGGQTALWGGDSDDETGSEGGSTGIRRLPADRPRLTVVRASAAEEEAHAKRLQALDKAAADGQAVWRRLDADPS